MAAWDDTDPGWPGGVGSLLAGNSTRAGAVAGARRPHGSRRDGCIDELVGTAWHGPRRGAGPSGLLFASRRWGVGGRVRLGFRGSQSAELVVGRPEGYVPEANVVACGEAAHLGRVCGLRVRCWLARQAGSASRGSARVCGWLLAGRAGAYWAAWLIVALLGRTCHCRRRAAGERFGMTGLLACWLRTRRSLRTSPL